MTMTQRVALAVLALFFCACDQQDSDTPSTSGSDPFEQFARPELPFAVHPEVERLRQKFTMAAPGSATHMEDEPGLMIGVATTYDTSIVVFPSGDREGFDLAWVQDRKDWQREPLNDFSLEDVGTVTAVAAPRDTPAQTDHFWIAFRMRSAPHDIHLYRWAPGTPLESIAFERETAAALPAHLDSCEDVALGVSPSGELDVIYRVGLRRIVQARRNANAWTSREVVSAALQAELETQAAEIGCHLRVDYDDGGFPNIVALRRRLADAPSDIAEPGKTLPKTELDLSTVGFFSTPSGAWLAHGRRRTIDDRGPIMYGPWLGLDIQRIGRTHILSGPFVHEREIDGKQTKLLFYAPSSFAHDYNYNVYTEFPNPGTIACSGSYLVVDEPHYAPHLGMSSFYASYHPSEWKFGRFPCDNTSMRARPVRYAPVLRYEPSENDNKLAMRSPVYAQGTRPVDFGVCIDQAGKLIVCAGGIPSSSEERAAFESWTLLEPAVFSMVETTTTRVIAPDEAITVKVVQESGPQSEPKFVVELLNVGQGDSARFVDVLATDLGNGTWQLTFAAGRGLSYRVGFDGPSDRLWRTSGVGFITVHVEGSPWLDPRVEVPIEDCVVWDSDAQATDRDERGVCRTAPRLERAGPAKINVYVDATSTTEEPRLLAPDGNEVPGTFVRSTELVVPTWSEFVPDEPLLGLVRYELHFPEGATNLFGLELPREHRILPYLTEQAPLAITHVSVADAQVDVPLDVELTVSFNGPLAVGLDLKLFVKLEKFVDDTMMTTNDVPLSFRERPDNTFEIRHVPLEPNASYRLSFLEGIIGEETRLSENIPLQINFKTEPSP